MPFLCTRAMDMMYPEDEIDGILEIKEEIKLKHMTLDQQKYSLSIIFGKIDENRDEQLDKDEMHEWMHKLEKHIMKTDVDENMAMCDLDKDGFVTEDELVTSQRLSDETKQAEKEMFAEIERFRAADENNDEQLTKEEFYAFLFPRNYERTKYLYVKEMMENMDDNEDGVITFDEFVLIKGIELSDQSEEVQLQLQVERRSFDKKDLNLNGALEGSELDAYLNPPDIKWYESEVMYLIGKIDRNDDLLLSKKEVIDNYTHIINTHFLAHGNIHHDEL